MDFGFCKGSVQAGTPARCAGAPMHCRQEDQIVRTSIIGCSKNERPKSTTAGDPNKGDEELAGISHDEAHGHGQAVGAHWEPMGPRQR